MTMSKPSKDVLIETLRGLLSEAFVLHQKGCTGARLGRSYGAADGYMRALIDIGLLADKELRAIVVEERTRLLGPAIQTLGATDRVADDETLAA
jgi:hypothetical protein